MTAESLTSGPAQAGSLLIRPPIHWLTPHPNCGVVIKPKQRRQRPGGRQFQKQHVTPGMTTQACARQGNDCSKPELGHPSPPPAPATRHVRPTHGLCMGDTVNVQRGHSWCKARVIDVHLGPAVLQEDLAAA